MSNINTTVGSRIRSIRRTRRLSQEELAKAIGQSQSSITAYERGVREPNFDALYSMATTMFVPISAFFEDYSNTYFDQVDMDRLKAFRKDPELCLLFDRIRRLSQSDRDLMTQLLNRLKQQ